MLAKYGATASSELPSLSSMTAQLPLMLSRLFVSLTLPPLEASHDIANSLMSPFMHVSNDRHGISMTRVVPHALYLLGDDLPLFP